jgi:hypothetical protein
MAIKHVTDGNFVNKTSEGVVLEIFGHHGVVHVR